MLAPPVAENRVTPTLGWPRNVDVDPRIGWPTVPRETLDWPQVASAGVVPSSPPETATAVPRIEIPPGPRRARFDEDEFGSLPVEQDPPEAVLTAKRVTTAALPAPPLPRIFVVANQKGGDRKSVV